ncbi:MAG: response regulator [Cyanobacteria bacterium P01_G01_bin.38]
MLPEQQQRIMGYFIEEAKDNLNTIEQGLLNLQSTIEDPEMANEVFRAAHSVKGGAAMLGIESVQRTAHRMEDYFKILKESPIKTDRDLESMFLQVFDAMKELVEQMQGPFGLTEDKAQEIMTGVEPVFGRLNDHLETLVQTASIEQLAPPPTASAPRQAPITYPEDSALQLVFKSDVSGCLREMLTLFKQDDNERSRSNLQAVCQRLKQLGEQFELTAWNDLIETAHLAIGNLGQDYRTLAPVLIKDIKKAQDLVLANRAPEVAVSEAMQGLLPEDVFTAAGSIDDLFADPTLDALDSAPTGLETSSTEFDDLFGAEPASTEANSVGTDRLGTSDFAETAEASPELDLDSDLFGETVAPEALDSEAFDLDLEGIEAISSLEGATPTTDESLDFLLDNAGDPMGPEVGDAELNSLADLFEGDLSDLDDAWQEEEIGTEASNPLSNPADIDITDDDFADLLENSVDASALNVVGDLDNEMANLFGDMLSEDSAGMTDNAVGGLDLVGNALEEGTQLDNALNELAATEADDQNSGLPSNTFDIDFDSGQDSASALSLDDSDSSIAAGDTASGIDGFEFEFSQPDAVTKIEPDALEVAPEGIVTDDVAVESSFDDLGLDFESDELIIADASAEALDAEAFALDFGENLSEPSDTNAESLSDELGLDFGSDIAEAPSADELDLDFGEDLSEPSDTNGGNLSDELGLDFGSDIAEAPSADELDLDFGEDLSEPSDTSGGNLSDELGLDFGGDTIEAPSADELDLEFTSNVSEPLAANRDVVGLSDGLDFDFDSSESDAAPPDLVAELDSLPADQESAEPMLAGTDDFFDELPSVDTASSPTHHDAIDSFFETPESAEELLDSPTPSPSTEVSSAEVPDIDLTQDPWDDAAMTAIDLSMAEHSSEPDIFEDSLADSLFEGLETDTVVASPPEELGASLDLETSETVNPESHGADLVLDDVGLGEVAPDEAPLENLFDTSVLEAASIEEVPIATSDEASDFEVGLPDDLFDEVPDAASLDLDFPQDIPGDLPDEALSSSSALPDDSLSMSTPETLTAPGFESDIGTDSLDDFNDLDALLETESALEGDALEEVTSGGFDAENNSEIAASPVEDNEFQDLERLLEEADQTLGGPTGASTTRRISPSVNRLASRRATGILGEQTMRVSVNHLDNLSNLVGELVVNRNTLEQDQERLRQFLDNLLFQVQQLNDVGQRMRDLYERSLLESSLISSRQAYSTANADGGSAIATPDDHATGETFDALEMDRFTGFHTLSQEMIELIVRVRESSSDIAYTVESSDQVTRQFRQVTTQLQEGLNKARMVPFAQTADRLPRAVRDISLKCGKEAGLVVEGRDTLIDKMILEQLYNPMTHLVNNAITHGVETPEQRLAAGKSREGTITVRAFYQGNQTVIYVADDGGGIDSELVKRKAVEKGLITQAEARSMSVLDVYELLFHPGFSTRDQADDFAGRGVGMDVVRTSLADIRGSITIDSELGKGTSFTIRLPLTLSISKALSCISNQARIAFPMDGVEDMLDVPKERIRTNNQDEACILWRDTMLPFQKLSDLLKFNRTLGRGRVYGGQVDDDVISIVVLRSASTYIALEVDQVIGEQEIVIKQLEGPVPKPVGIAGATVLGDGRVMPIADVLELIDIAMGRVRREPTTALWSQPAPPAAEEPAATKSEPTVLIVDDSITVRELLSMSFNKVGYRVEQARDGQEAWEKLKSGLPCDLVFCDIEMPRMDGLELLSRMQKDGALKQIPIAMLTSRGADRHRQMAVDLGASGYFTKPYLEEALLDAANKMLNGERIG